MKSKYSYLFVSATIISVSILFFIFFFLFPTFSFASHKIFTDNFDNNSLDNWVRVDDPDRISCSSQWIIKDGMVGISINESSCTTNFMPKDSAWNALGNNYSIELDVKFIRGTDHNIAFRFTPGETSNNWYDIHFQNPGDFIIERAPGFYNISVAANYYNDQTYHLKIIVNDKKIQVFVNGSLIKDFTISNDVFSTGRFALRAGTGSDPGSETYFDNIVVTSIDSVLNVPSLKQTSDPWQSQVYDAADSWSPGAPNIKNWGCALTSAAMVLQFHGINKLPDATGLDPGTLNSWLKNQPDGYIGDGLINWLAISRLSALAKNVNNISAFDALEYRRIAGEDKTQLTQDIGSSRPDILEEPGHFIVAKGANNSTFDINDPYYDRSTLNNGYSNTFLSLGRYIPSQTNLAYIMLVGSLDTDFYIASPSGKKAGSNTAVSFNEIVGADYYTQNGIINKTGGAVSAGRKILIMPVPADGAYNVYIATTDADLKQVSLKLYEYGASGSATVHALSGYAKKDEPAAFSFVYKQNPAGDQDAPIDKTPPQMNKALTLDKDKDGMIDAVRIEFLKDINGSTLNPSGSDFSINGRIVTRADEIEPGIVEITLAEANYDTGDTFDVALKGDGQGTDSFGIKDTATNTWSHEQRITARDGAPPTKISVDIPGGDYLVYKDVALGSSDSANTVAMYYTLDSSDPATSASRLLYSGPIRIDNDLVLKAISFDPSNNKSDIVTQIYGIAPVIDNGSVLVSSTTNNSFTVGWNTNRPSKSRVVFGKNSIVNLTNDSKYGYEFATEEDGAFVVSHLVDVGSLTPGQTYYYRVLSRASPEQIGEEKNVTLPNIVMANSSNAVASPVSNSSANFSSAGPTLCAYGKPKGTPKITSVFAGLNTVTIAWDEPEGPLSYYLISYGTEAGKPLYGNPNIGGKGTTSYVIQNLSGGQKYYFKVRAGNNCAPGDYSEEVSATPLGFAADNRASGFKEGVLGATQNIEEEKKGFFEKPAEIKGARDEKRDKKALIIFLAALSFCLVSPAYLLVRKYLIHLPPPGKS